MRTFSMPLPGQVSLLGVGHGGMWWMIVVLARMSAQARAYFAQRNTSTARSIFLPDAF
jgi:hypothetical protein